MGGTGGDGGCRGHAMGQGGHWWVLLTPLAGGQVAAPRQVPVAHQKVGAGQLEAGVAVVGDHGAMEQLWLRRCLPAVGNVWQLGAGVVTGDLCGDRGVRGVAGTPGTLGRSSHHGAHQRSG